MELASKACSQDCSLDSRQVILSRLFMINTLSASCACDAGKGTSQTYGLLISGRPFPTSDCCIAPTQVIKVPMHPFHAKSLKITKCMCHMVMMAVRGLTRHIYTKHNGPSIKSLQSGLL
jgi:hypothetical protein